MKQIYQGTHAFAEIAKFKHHHVFERQPNIEGKLGNFLLKPPDHDEELSGGFEFFILQGLLRSPYYHNYHMLVFH